MANAVKKRGDVVKYVVEMTKEEAEVLRWALSRMGGNPSEFGRKQTDAINIALADAGAKESVDCVADSVHKRIYFGQIPEDLRPIIDSM